MDEGQLRRPTRIKELLLVFARLGCLGFGGPIATIAMMEEETRRKRGWLSEAQFAEIYAICKMLPGPVATQVAIYLGFVRGGRLGGFLAGVVYILPSFLMVLAFSAIYVTQQIGSEYQHFFTSLQTAALVVILISTLQLARPMRGNWKAIAIAVISGVVVGRFPRWEPVVILAAGVAGAIAVARRSPPRASQGPTRTFLFSPPSFPIAAGAIAAGSVSPTLLQDLFWVCFKAGAFVFGTGLAIIPLLEADTVRLHHWLTHSEFMDGLAIGQVTPGPVTITVTFIGYKTAGLVGAIVATVGMFLPPFINVLYIVPTLWKRVSGTPAAAGFTSWALPAVVGGILVTSFQLARGTITTPLLMGLFVVALGVAVRFKPPAWLLIPVSGVVGGALARIVGT